MFGKPRSGSVGRQSLQKVGVVCATTRGGSLSTLLATVLTGILRAVSFDKVTSWCTQCTGFCGRSLPAGVVGLIGLALSRRQVCSSERGAASERVIHWHTDRVLWEDTRLDRRPTFVSFLRVWS